MNLFETYFMVFWRVFTFYLLVCFVFCFFYHVCFIIHTLMGNSIKEMFRINPVKPHLKFAFNSAPSFHLFSLCESLENLKEFSIHIYIKFTAIFRCVFEDFFTRLIWYKREIISVIRNTWCCVMFYNLFSLYLLAVITNNFILM